MAFQAGREFIISLRAREFPAVGMELFRVGFVIMGMLARLFSAAVQGIDGRVVRVELDLANGLPTFTTVGLPDCSVREARERVVSAIRNSSYEFPGRRITVNLAPAQMRKAGTHFDLPIAAKFPEGNKHDRN